MADPRLVHARRSSACGRDRHRRRSSLIAPAIVAVRRRPKSSFSWPSCCSAEGRYIEALEAYRAAQRHDDPRIAREARTGIVKSALRVAEFDSRARRSAQLLRGRAATMPSRSRSTAMRCGRPGSSRRPRTYQDALAHRLPTSARGHHGMARAWPPEPARRGADRSAGRAPPRSPRPRDPPHGRLHLRAHAPVRGGGRRVQQLRQPAAEQGPQRQRPPGRAPRSSSCASFGQRVPFEIDPAPEDEIYTVRFRLVERQGRRQREGQRGTLEDFVVDTGVGADGDSRATARAAGHHADHLHAERRRRRRRACAGCSSARHRLARARHRSRCATSRASSRTRRSRDLPDARMRELVAAGARLLDDHRLRPAGS